MQAKPAPKEKPSIGARWDDARQDSRFRNARRRGLVDYAEVNFPISPSESPYALGLPILAHTSNNPVASALGMDRHVMAAVRDGARRAKSPWVGEHLAWLGAEATGALGYVINPVFSQPFVAIAAENVRRLQRCYGRKIALELGPVYALCGEMDSELEFLNEVARAADTAIILDVTHWMISNRNMGRPEAWGLDVLDRDRVIELHVAGMRRGRSSDYWNDAHGVALSDDVLAMTRHVLTCCHGIRAITFEHSMDGPEDDFYAGLERLQEIVQ